jgi:hypothetical protein
MPGAEDVAVERRAKRPTVSLATARLGPTVDF